MPLRMTTDNSGVRSPNDEFVRLAEQTRKGYHNSYGYCAPNLHGCVLMEAFCHSVCGGAELCGMVFCIVFLLIEFTVELLMSCPWVSCLTLTNLFSLNNFSYFFKHFVRTVFRWNKKSVLMEICIINYYWCITRAHTRTHIHTHSSATTA